MLVRNLSYGIRKLLAIASSDYIHALEKWTKEKISGVEPWLLVCKLLVTLINLLNLYVILATMHVLEGWLWKNQINLNNKL